MNYLVQQKAWLISGIQERGKGIMAMDKSKIKDIKSKFLHIHE
jgi:hypothetical protein